MLRRSDTASQISSGSKLALSKLKKLSHGTDSSGSALAEDEQNTLLMGSASLPQPLSAAATVEAGCHIASERLPTDGPARAAEEVGIIWYKDRQVGPSLALLCMLRSTAKTGTCPLEPRPFWKPRMQGILNH